MVFLNDGGDFYFWLKSVKNVCSDLHMKEIKKLNGDISI